MSDLLDIFVVVAEGIAGGILASFLNIPIVIIKLFLSLRIVTIRDFSISSIMDSVLSIVFDIFIYTRSHSKLSPLN